MNLLIVQDTKDGAILTVHIQPKASTTECVGIHGDAVKDSSGCPTGRWRSQRRTDPVFSPPIIDFFYIGADSIPVQAAGINVFS